MNLFLDIYRGCDKWCMSLSINSVGMHMCASMCKLIVSISANAHWEFVKWSSVITLITTGVWYILHCRLQGTTQFVIGYRRHRQKHPNERHENAFVYYRFVQSAISTWIELNTSRIFHAHMLNVMIHHHYSVTPQIVNKYWRNNISERNICWHSGLPSIPSILQIVNLYLIHCFRFACVEWVDRCGYTGCMQYSYTKPSTINWLKFNCCTTLHPMWCVIHCTQFFNFFFFFLLLSAFFSVSFIFFSFVYNLHKFVAKWFLIFFAKMNESIG